jgi:hypothetical protein
LVVDETKTFSYIDIEQFYVVNNNVTALYVKACGAQGEGAGCIVCSTSVTPSETLLFI